MSDLVIVLLRSVALLAPSVLIGCDRVAATPDASCEPTWSNVLVNAGFDDGHVTWTEEPVEPPSVCGASQVPFAVDSAPFAACLGTDNDRVQTLSQIVELPAGTTRVRLRGQRCLLTREATADINDTLAIELRDGDTFATIADLGGFSNVDGRDICDWAGFQLEANVTSSPRRGQL